MLFEQLEPIVNSVFSVDRPRKIFSERISTLLKREMNESIRKTICDTFNISGDAKQMAIVQTPTQFEILYLGWKSYIDCDWNIHNFIDVLDEKFRETKDPNLKFLLDGALNIVFGDLQRTD